MRCLTLFALVALIAVLALAGHDHWQINRLNRELTAVKAKVHAGEPAGGGQDDLAKVLAHATQHAHRAKELLAKGKAESARLELDKSLRSLEKAAELSQGAGATRGVGAALSAVQKQVEEAWQEISKQSARRRPEGNGRTGGE